MSRNLMLLRARLTKLKLNILYRMRRKGRFNGNFYYIKEKYATIE